MPLEDVAERPRPGRVRADPKEALAIGRGQLAGGLVRPLRSQECVHVKGEPLLNGLFGVSKKECLPDGRAHLRLIMNLTATNGLMVDWSVDIWGPPVLRILEGHHLREGPRVELELRGIVRNFLSLPAPGRLGPMIRLRLRV